MEIELKFRDTGAKSVTLDTDIVGEPSDEALSGASAYAMTVVAMWNAGVLEEAAQEVLNAAREGKHPEATIREYFGVSD